MAPLISPKAKPLPSQTGQPVNIRNAPSLPTAQDLVQRYKSTGLFDENRRRLVKEFNASVSLTRWINPAEQAA